MVMSGFRLISMMLPDTFFSRRQSTCRPTPIMTTRAVSSMGAGMPSVMLRSKTGWDAARVRGMAGTVALTPVVVNSKHVTIAWAARP